MTDEYELSRQLGLFEQMILSRLLTEAEYHVFHTDIGLVAVDRETGKFDSKDYKQIFL